jgi:hypothetical protein
MILLFAAIFAANTYAVSPVPASVSIAITRRSDDGQLEQFSLVGTSSKLRLATTSNFLDDSVQEIGIFEWDQSSVTSPLPEKLQALIQISQKTSHRPSSMQMRPGDIDQGQIRVDDRVLLASSPEAKALQEALLSFVKDAKWKALRTWKAPQGAAAQKRQCKPGRAGALVCENPDFGRIVVVPTR